MKHDDLSERLRQHGNWLYGIGTPTQPLKAADFLAAGARIDRLQAELDALNADDSLTIAYMAGFHDGKRSVKPFNTVLNEAPAPASISFDLAARPLIKWMAENGHPHHTAIITSNSAELLEGKRATRTNEFLKD